MFIAGNHIAFEMVCDQVNIRIVDLAIEFCDCVDKGSLVHYPHRGPLNGCRDIPARIQHNGMNLELFAGTGLDEIVQPSGLCLGLGYRITVRLETVYFDFFTIVGDYARSFCRLAISLDLPPENWTNLKESPLGSRVAQGGQKCEANGSVRSRS